MKKMLIILMFIAIIMSSYALGGSTTNIAYSSHVQVSEITKTNDNDYIITVDTLVFIGAAETLSIANINISVSPYAKSELIGIIVASLRAGEDTLVSVSSSIHRENGGAANMIAQNGNALNIPFATNRTYGDSTAVILEVRQLSLQRQGSFGTYIDYFPGAFITTNVIGSTN